MHIEAVQESNSVTRVVLNIKKGLKHSIKLLNIVIHTCMIKFMHKNLIFTIHTYITIYTYTVYINNCINLQYTHVCVCIRKRSYPAMRRRDDQKYDVGLS